MSAASFLRFLASRSHAAARQRSLHELGVSVNLGVANGSGIFTCAIRNFDSIVYVQFLPLPSIGTDLDLTSVIEHPDFQGCATITVGNETREMKAGGIVVIPANTPHRFVNSGNTTLRQIDIHASPRFIQMNLT